MAFNISQKDYIAFYHYFTIKTYIFDGISILYRKIYINEIDDKFFWKKKDFLSCTVFRYCNITESNKVGKPSSRATI